MEKTNYPAPIEITKAFWDFIEQNLPDYHIRKDVVRQAELQNFIDGNQSTVTELTREEAVWERNRLLFRIYAESIDAFTINSQKMVLLHDKIISEQEKGYKYLLVYRNNHELVEKLNNDFYTISDTNGAYLCDLLKPDFLELTNRLIIIDSNMADDDCDYMSDWVLTDETQREEVLSQRAAIVFTEGKWIDKV